MRVRPNPQYLVFLAGLERIKPRFAKFSGIAFRATPLEFARRTKLLDGKGGFNHGGRWCAPRTFRAVNLSTTQEAALRESQANFAYYNFEAGDLRLRIIVGVKLRLRKVINLAELQHGGSQPWLRLTELLAEDWRSVNDGGGESRTQAFGRAAHDLGAEALLAPSARVPGGVNLIYFPDAIASSAGIKILGEAELRRWLKTR